MRARPASRRSRRVPRRHTTPTDRSAARWRIPTPPVSAEVRDVAASFQQAIVDVLVDRTMAAAECMVSLGGRFGRCRMQLLASRHDARPLLRGRARARDPLSPLLHGHAAMIAAAGILHLERGEHAGLELSQRRAGGSEGRGGAHDPAAQIEPQTAERWFPRHHVTEPSCRHDRTGVWMTRSQACCSSALPEVRRKSHHLAFAVCRGASVSAIRWAFGVERLEARGLEIVTSETHESRVRGGWRRAPSPSCVSVPI